MNTTLPKRMKHDARRGAILTAAAPLFARGGLHGTTTRELAAAAGISEALLLKHFLTKEALYLAVGREYLGERPLLPELARLRAMPPSTARLVTAVHYLVDALAQPGQDELPRLFAHSLLGDGAVARAVLERFRAEALPVLAESLAAARRAGDLRAEDGAGDTETLWLTYHLAMMRALLHLAPGAGTASSQSHDAAVRQVVHFVLHGIGLRSAALREFYPAPAAKAKASAKSATKAKAAPAKPVAKPAKKAVAAKAAPAKAVAKPAAKPAAKAAARKAKAAAKPVAKPVAKPAKVVAEPAKPVAKPSRAARRSARG